MRSITTAALWLIIAGGHFLPFVTADEPEEPLPLLTVSANRFGSEFELVTLDISGQNAKLELPFQCAATDPFWSPDGRKLLYASFKSGVRQAYQFDVDRGEEINLTNTGNHEHQPIWSPDGKRIVFTSERTGNHEIFAMNADGSNPVNLTNNAAFDSDPSWSPDGKQIVFGSNRARGFWRIYAIDADGSNLHDVLGRNLDGWNAPSWSPDGKQILYTGPGNGGTLQIFIANSDGKAAEALTDGPGCNGFAVFSPDGRYIAYVHYEGRMEHHLKDGGVLMVYDLETLTNAPVAPEGMRCSVSKVVWKPKRRSE